MKHNPNPAPIANSRKQRFWSAGLMSGTVIDGMIDVAFIKTDGVDVFEWGPYALETYPQDIVALLRTAIEAASKWKFMGPMPPILMEAQTALTIAQANAVRNVALKNAIALDEIDVVGFHGQTVLHRPPTKGAAAGKTCQLGDGQLMANLLGVVVVNDFRSHDMRAGGQGAPLTPIYHQALLRHWLRNQTCFHSSNAANEGHRAGEHITCPVTRPSQLAIVNLGGVGNITWVGDHDELIAFDTGPANAPINDWVRQLGAGEFDRDGVLAEQGKADQALLEKWLSHPYFDQRPPKSLDRNAFTSELATGLNLQDGAAMLTSFVAQTIKKALAHLPAKPKALAVCGGGRKNRTLLDLIRRYCEIELLVAEDLGWRGEAVEAECFAYLAKRSLRNLPISFPSTTGVPEPLTGGRHWKSEKL